MRRDGHGLRAGVVAFVVRKRQRTVTERPAVGPDAAFTLRARAHVAVVPSASSSSPQPAIHPPAVRTPSVTSAMLRVARVARISMRESTARTPFTLLPASIHSVSVRRTWPTRARERRCEATLATGPDRDPVRSPGEQLEFTDVVRAEDLHLACLLTTQLAQATLIEEPQLAILVHQPLVEAQPGYSEVSPGPFPHDRR